MYMYMHINCTSMNVCLYISILSVVYPRPFPMLHPSHDEFLKLLSPPPVPAGLSAAMEN